MNEEQLKNFKRLISKEKSGWHEKAKFRIENREWLRYSSQIARRIFAVTIDSSDKKVAIEKYMFDNSLPNLLKGWENLTIKQISEIATIIEMEVIEFPTYKYSKK